MERNKLSIKKFDRKKFQKINKAIALNVLYARKKYPTHVSKLNSNRETQVFL